MYQKELYCVLILSLTPTLSPNGDRGYPCLCDRTGHISTKEWASLKTQQIPHSLQILRLLLQIALGEWMVA